MLTQEDEDAYTVKLAEALANCEGRRAEVVGLVDDAQKPKPRWPF